ncbi:N-acetyltransferase [Kitasatospora xanthocidica]|uniref:N-acetyltransferase n=1 Tax=Kitasatospora xanthocidica TaxID=83382 RepID=A0A373A0X7_9ACTN|nr:MULTISPECIES: GNAT family N-acetyltransferase [Streptomycetaceae]OKI10528.1 GCN5 family acetyltransferase [Streptomyces sp. CB02056]RGD61227.1 N-acetyltransferase [Kitasatospora xanthocidica]
MITLEPLRPDHAEALLAFERANRAYFARSIPDRGDAYFAGFADRHAALLAEQAEGTCRFHVVLDAAGGLVGRANLVDLADGSAELGYRIAESAAGRGVAKAAVAEACRLAATAYGLTVLTAVTTVDNPASQAVLARNGFALSHRFLLADRPALAYRRPLGDLG